MKATIKVRRDLLLLRVKDIAARDASSFDDARKGVLAEAESKRLEKIKALDDTITVNLQSDLGKYLR